ncbi:unnamed protein product, partial [Ectocarpus sp. 12 AP-2014]
CVDTAQRKTSERARQARNVYLPPGKARVKHADQDGKCAYHAIRGGLLRCVGQAKTPPVPAIKTALVSSLLHHVIGTACDPEATLSGDELQKGRDLGLTEIRNPATGEVTQPEPAGEKKYGWFEGTVEQKLEVKWL